MSDAASRREQAMFDSSNDRVRDSVDFLIVGGGAAGSVLGNRLSEDSSVRVLLLEAGPDYAATRDVPEDLLDANQFPSSHDWGYQSEPGVLGRSIPVPRAKVIGGSTAHNGAVAGRGTPEDYDEWSRLGNPGWSFEQLLDDFRRLEDDPEGDVRYHGRGGPVPIRRYTDRLSLLHRSFIRTATASGFRRVEDVNGPDHIGVGVVARNVVDGVRQNGSIAYLERVRQRTNLEIRGEAEVDRVVIEEGRAVGVMLTSGELLHAGHVVLSAGVYGSPAILMRSGIGPAEELTSLGIDVVADVPGVGAHLAEQPIFSRGVRGRSREADGADAARADDADRRRTRQRGSPVAARIPDHIRPGRDEPHRRRVRDQRRAAQAAVTGASDARLAGPQGSAADRRQPARRPVGRRFDGRRDPLGPQAGPHRAARLAAPRARCSPATPSATTRTRSQRF